MKLNKSFKLGKLKIIILILMVGLLIGCGSSNNIKSISVVGNTTTLETNQSSTFTVMLEPTDSTIKEEDIVIEDKDMLEIETIKNNMITIKSKSKAGTTQFYVNANNIESNKMSITVVDNSKAEAEEKAKAEAETQKKAEEEKLAQEAEAQRLAQEAEAQRLAQEAEAERLAQEQANQQSTPPQAEEPQANTSTPNSMTVYLTKTGSKYHSHTNCGNSKTAYPVTLEQAIAQGYDACQKCF